MMVFLLLAPSNQQSNDHDHTDSDDSDPEILLLVFIVIIFVLPETEINVKGEVGVYVLGHDMDCFISLG